MEQKLERLKVSEGKVSQARREMMAIAVFLKRFQESAVLPSEVKDEVERLLMNKLEEYDDRVDYCEEDLEIVKDLVFEEEDEDIKCRECGCSLFPLSPENNSSNLQMEVCEDCFCELMNEVGRVED